MNKELLSSLAHPGAARELWAGAAIREQFGAGDLLDAWLKLHVDPGADVLRQATHAALQLQQAAKPALGAEGEAVLRLPTALRWEVLRNIGPDAARTAFNALAPETQTKTESYLRRLLDDGALPFDPAKATDRNDLVALRTAAESAQASGATLAFNPEMILEHTRRFDLMMQLGGPDLHRFVGRFPELAVLHEAWAKRGPKVVLIEGPGGMGKSLLVSRFVSEILRTKLRNRPVAVFHLDFDRADLQQADERVIVNELIRQSLRWAPRKYIEPLLSDDDRYRWRKEGNYGSSRSALRLFKSESRISRLAEILRGRFRVSRCRIVLFMDSCEQVFGYFDSAVLAARKVSHVLEMARIDVMTIAASRSFQTVTPMGWSNATRIRLNALQPEEARAYLQTETARQGQRVDPAMVDSVIAAVGTSPLALRLAAALLEREGDALRPEDWAEHLRNDPERLQAALYERLLKRIRDPELRKIALPGLLVRRINEGVITEVLAGPCALRFDSITAQDLVLRGGQLGQLFVRDPSDPDPGALWHRQDVRALMLADLDASVKTETARQINEAAITYYSRSDDVVSRAEEIYHRLRSGQDWNAVAGRWVDGVGTRLRGALEELPPTGQATLRRMLGTASTDSLRRLVTATSGLGEDGAAELRAIVRRELQTAGPGLAPLETLTGFGVSGVKGPLGDLYAEALVAAGRIGDLRDAVSELRAEPVDHVRSSIFATTAGALEGAYESPHNDLLRESAYFWGRAAEFSGDGTIDARLAVIGARVGYLRVGRKLVFESPRERDNPRFRADRVERVREVLAEVRAAHSELQEHPVLWREVVAELQDVFEQPELDPEHVIRNLLMNLLEAGEAFPSAQVDPQRRDFLGQSLGINYSNGPGFLRELFGIASKFAYGSADMVKLLTDIIRNEVDWTLRRAVVKGTDEPPLPS